MNLSSLLVRTFSSNLSPGFWSQLTWAIFRAGVGILMIHNGLDKLADIQGFSQAYVEVIGLPFPLFFSYLAALTELLGAPLVAIGLFTRPAAFALFGTMAVAMYHHILVAGLNLPYLELSAIYAASFLFLTVNGSGLFSCDALILARMNSAALSTRALQIMRLESALEASSNLNESEKITAK